MKNECTAWQTQSIETERAYQLHKYVSLHCFFYSVKKVMTPEAAQLSISGCVCIHVCS